MKQLVRNLTLFSLLALQTSVWAQIAELNVIRSEQRHLSTLRDSLLLARATVEAEADSISDVIDSLKMAGDFGLPDCLLASMSFVRRMAEIDGALHRVSADSLAVTQSLREAYDWQISRLFGMLAETPDDGLLHQLKIYQEERQALGDDIAGAYLRFSGEMEIAADDGPDEIRQKIEYLKGTAERFDSELRRIERGLRKLEHEDRMVDIMWVTHSRKGEQGIGGIRAPHTDRRESSETGALPVRVTTTADDPGARQADGVPGRDAAIRSVPRWSSDLILKRRQLKARQQELNQLLAVVEERITSFQARHDELLDGDEWGANRLNMKAADGAPSN